MSRVTRVEDETFGIDLMYSGYYTESIVCNGTNSNIIVMGANNNKKVIKPDPRNNNGKVTIIIRSINGPRQKFTQTGVQELKATTVKYEIDKVEIEKGYFYHEDTDLVIATSEIGDSINHPDAKKNYDEMLEEAMVTLIGKEATTVVFAINDPLNRTPVMYGCIGGHCFRIKCLTVKNKGTLATLSIKLCDGISILSQSTIDIEEIFINGTITCTAFDRLMTVGVTANDALEQYTNIQEKQNLELSSIIEKRVLEQRKIIDIKCQAEKEKHLLLLGESQRELENLKHKHDVLKNDHELLKEDLKSKTALLKEWEGVREYQASETKRNMELNSLASKDREQEHKTIRAKWAVNEESAKIIASVVGIIISAAIGAAIKTAMSNKK